MTAVIEPGRSTLGRQMVAAAASLVFGMEIDAADGHDAARISPRTWATRYPTTPSSVLSPPSSSAWRR